MRRVVRWFVTVPILGAATAGALLTDWVSKEFDYDYGITLRWCITAFLVQLVVVGAVTIALGLVERLRDPSVLDHIRYSALV